MAVRLSMSHHSSETRLLFIDLLSQKCNHCLFFADAAARVIKLQLWQLAVCDSYGLLMCVSLNPP